MVTPTNGCQLPADATGWDEAAATEWCTAVHTTLLSRMRMCVTFALERAGMIATTFHLQSTASLLLWSHTQTCFDVCSHGTQARYLGWRIDVLRHACILRAEYTNEAGKKDQQILFAYRFTPAWWTQEPLDVVRREDYDFQRIQEQLRAAPEKYPVLLQFDMAYLPFINWVLAELTSSDERARVCLSSPTLGRIPDGRLAPGEVFTADELFSPELLLRAFDCVKPPAGGGKATAARKLRVPAAAPVADTGTGGADAT